MKTAPFGSLHPVGEGRGLHVEQKEHPGLGHSAWNCGDLRFEQKLRGFQDGKTWVSALGNVGHVGLEDRPVELACGRECGQRLREGRGCCSETFQCFAECLRVLNAEYLLYI